DAGGTPRWGFSAFDREGRLYVTNVKSTDSFAIATHAPGRRLRARTFDAHGPLQYLWISGSQIGPGALVTWAVGHSCEAGPIGGSSQLVRSDVYAAHVRIAHGLARLSDESIVAKDLPGLFGDYMGSSLGPDGRAYVAVYSSDRPTVDVPGHEPLFLYAQDGGPTL